MNVIFTKEKQLCRGRRETLEGWSTGKWMPPCYTCKRFQPCGMLDSPREMWLAEKPQFIIDCPEYIKRQ